MQKTILTIIALALCGYAHAQVESAGACPSNITVQCNFDVASYLGTWYQYASYPVYFEADGKCVTAEYSLKDNGEVGVVNTMINKTNNESSNIVGYAVMVEPAKLTVTFPITQTVSASTNYWVLATDYTNYSVVYSCQPTGDNSHNTIVWILTRERVPSSEIIQTAEGVLKQNGVSLTELVVTDQSDCGASTTDCA